MLIACYRITQFANIDSRFSKKHKRSIAKSMALGMVMKFVVCLEIRKIHLWPLGG